MIRIKDIKREVWGNYMINRPSSNSTIANTLRKKLRMSYKVLKVRHPKVFLAVSKRLYIEAALIQNILNRNGYVVVFIDKFQITNRN